MDYSFELTSGLLSKQTLIQELRQAVSAILKSPSLLPTIQTCHLVVMTHTEFWPRTSKIFALLQFSGMQGQLVPYNKAFVVNIFAKENNGVEISSDGVKNFGEMGGVMGKLVGNSVVEAGAASMSDSDCICQLTNHEGETSCDDADPFANIIKCTGDSKDVPGHCVSPPRSATTPNKRIWKMVTASRGINSILGKLSLFKRSKSLTSLSESPNSSIYTSNGSETAVLSDQTQYTTKLCGKVKSLRDATNIVRRRLMAREAAMGSGTPRNSETIKEMCDKLSKDTLTEHSSAKILQTLNGFTSELSCLCLEKLKSVGDVTNILPGNGSLQVGKLLHLPECRYVGNELILLPIASSPQVGELAVDSELKLFKSSKKSITPESAGTHVLKSVKMHAPESVEMQVSESVETQVSESVETQVSESVETQISESVETQISEIIETHVSESVEAHVSESVETRVSESAKTCVSESVEMHVLESNDLHNRECSAARCRPISEYINTAYCMDETDITLPGPSLNDNRTMRKCPGRKCKRETTPFVPLRRRKKPKVVDDRNDRNDRNWDDNYSSMAAVTSVNLSKLVEDLVYSCPVVVLQKLKEEPPRQMSRRTRRSRKV